MINFNFITLLKSKSKLKKPFKYVKSNYLFRIRFAIAAFYFAMGLTFSSWASRIPDIKTALNLDEADLGKLLFAVPLGQLVTMTFAGKIVTRFGSSNIVLLVLLLYAVSLTSLGCVSESWQLAIALFFFGMFGNICNISVNTQGVHMESLLKKTVMASFHGMWSFAGFIGALIGLVLVSFHFSALKHFICILIIVVLLMVFNFKFLIKAKEKTVAKTEKFFSKPDATLIWLGLIGFCCMASEGIMFDWSGVYFKEIVNAPASLVILGYTSFMIMMATGRFVGDRLVQKFGMKHVLQISGLMISAGLYLAVIFPYLIICTLAFMIVGLGVSSVVPAVYSIAGKNKKVSPSQALTIISSVSFFGFLIGPPVIGFIAEATSLRWSFAFIGIFGILIIFMVSKVKNLI